MCLKMYTTYNVNKIKMQKIYFHWLNLKGGGVVTSKPLLGINKTVTSNNVWQEEAGYTELFITLALSFMNMWLCQQWETVISTWSPLVSTFNNLQPQEKTCGTHWTAKALQRATLPYHLSCLAELNAICSELHSLYFLSFSFLLDEPKAYHKPKEEQNQGRVTNPFYTSP